jgi:hypothetical protein
MECPICHQWYTPGDGLTMNPNAYPHTCPPKWRVWNPETGDAVEIYAYQAETAVEDWAEQDDSNSAEYDIAKGEAATVCVQRAEKDGSWGATVKYRVTGEFEPSYDATLVE